MKIINNKYSDLNSIKKDFINKAPFPHIVLDDFLDKYLSKYGSKLYEIHISENNGIKDQHLPVKKDSWQLPVLDRIKSIKLDNGQERIYCLESRRANKTELIESLNLIEEAIS